MEQRAPSVASTWTSSNSARGRCPPTPERSRLTPCARPKHFIGHPSQEVRVAFRVLLRNVAHPLGAICVLPPVIHRVCVEDTIQGDPRFHPKLSHVSSPFHFMFFYVRTFATSAWSSRRRPRASTPPRRPRRRCPYRAAGGSRASRARRTAW